MASNIPLISVIIPVYNVELYVKKAINSILNQTYSNLQIIIIDDCSTDRTYEIVQNISKLDSRVLILRNKINSKIVKTLNYGLEYARGEYIARMDGDDICSADRIEKQYSFLINNPEYSLVGNHVYTINENDEKIGHVKFPTDFLTIKKTIKLTSPVLHIWLAKSEVYKKLKGYREIPGAEDYDFLLRMLSEGFKFINLDSYEYSVRVRNGNTTSTIGFQQRLMSNYVLELFEERKKFNIDRYSVADVIKYLDKYKKHKSNFDKSNEYLRQAFNSKVHKNYIKMLSMIFMTVITSRFQLQYMLKRLIFKIKV